MDIQLYYEEKGTGEPLILLHGNGEDGSYFVHQMAYFSKYYRVIAIDTRGHGKSPRGTKDFTIKQFAEDLHDFMDTHQIGKAYLLGFSDGGNIALTFALKYPERVKKLVLNGANLSPKGVRAAVQVPIVLGYKMALLFAKKSKDAGKKAEMLGLMVNEPDISPKELHRLPVRTLVIAGTKDMIKTEHTILIYKNLKRAELVFMDGDHFIANKEWKKFNAKVRTFLKDGR